MPFQIHRLFLFYYPVQILEYLYLFLVMLFDFCYPLDFCLYHLMYLVLHSCFDYFCHKLYHLVVFCYWILCHPNYCYLLHLYEYLFQALDLLLDSLMHLYLDSVFDDFCLKLHHLVVLFSLLLRQLDFCYLLHLSNYFFFDN